MTGVRGRRLRRRPRTRSLAAAALTLVFALGAFGLWVLLAAGPDRAPNHGLHIQEIDALSWAEARSILSPEQRSVADSARASVPRVLPKHAYAALHFLTDYPVDRITPDSPVKSSGPSAPVDSLSKGCAGAR